MIEEVLSQEGYSNIPFSMKRDDSEIRSPCLLLYHLLKEERYLVERWFFRVSMRYHS